MKNETSVIKENKINIMTVLKQIFWDSEKEEVDDVSQIANISEKELKELIYGIEQRYYTTEIGNEKRLANSVIKL